jgi:hypothetical protein
MRNYFTKRGKHCLFVFCASFGILFYFFIFINFFFFFFASRNILKCSPSRHLLGRPPEELSVPKPSSHVNFLGMIAPLALAAAVACPDCHANPSLGDQHR